MLLSMVGVYFGPWSLRS